MLAAIDGIDDVAMTTNGSLLARKARALADAGLRRVTVSLDSLDDAVFGAVNDVDFPVERVLEGIEARGRRRSAGQGEHGREARPERRLRARHGRTTSAAPGTCCG